MTQPFNPFATAVDDTDDDSSFTEPFGSTTPFEEPVPVQQKKPEQVTNSFSSPNGGKKYNIIDMYWLINNKLFNKTKLNENEISLISLGYNSDFNNLRIVLHEVNDKVFTESAILKHEAKILTSVNVFSETCAKVMYNMKKGVPDAVHNFERIISSEQWKPNQSAFELDLASASIILKVNFNNIVYSYSFTDWQIDVLSSCFRFMTNGDSWKSSLMNK